MVWHIAGISEFRNIPEVRVIVAKVGCISLLSELVVFGREDAMSANAVECGSQAAYASE